MTEMMERQNFKWSNQLICCVLLLASLLPFVFGTCVRFNSWDSAADEIEEALSMAAAIGSWMGLDIDADGVKKANRAMSDGKVSGSEAFTVARETEKVVRELMTVEEDQSLSKLKDACVIYMVIYIGFLVSAAGLSVSVLTGKGKTLMCVLYAGFGGAICLFFVVLSQDLEMTGIPPLVWILATIAAMFSISREKSDGEDEAKPIENLQPSAPRERKALLAEVLENREGIRDRLWQSPTPYCGGCGCRNDSDARFCAHCGKPLGSFRTRLVT